jgi:hypothetical protein
MKKNYFFSAVLAIAAAVACTEKGPVDFPIQGDLTLYGENVAGQEVGVFVTSDGLPQSNLLYTAAEGEGDGAVALTAKAEKAGFKQGNHMIYAYAPYAEAAAELTAIPMPDLANQNLSVDVVPDWAIGTGMEDMFAVKTTNFAPFQIAQTEVKEYSSAAITLAFDAPVATQVIQFSEISFPDGSDALIGKKINKIVVSSDAVIGYTAGAYNYVESKVATTPAKSLTLNVDMEVTKVADVVGKAFAFATTLTEEELQTVKFTVEVYVDSAKYVATDYGMGSWGTFPGVVVSPAQ